MLFLLLKKHCLVIIVLIWLLWPRQIHWFDFKAFYSEVKRTLKHGGLLAVITYGLLKINVDADKIINHLNTWIIHD